MFEYKLSHMFPAAKWLDALKLPIKTKIAVAAACAVLLFLFTTKRVSVGSLDTLVTTLLVIAVVVFAILVVFDAVAWLLHPLTEKRKGSLLAARRLARRNELQDQRTEERERVLERLNHLSKQEIHYVAQALKENSPTFYTYVHAPPVGMLLGKNLVWTTNGTHHQDHYPFSFHDYIWTEILARRDEFIAKEQAFLEAEEREANSRRRRP